MLPLTASSQAAGFHADAMNALLRRRLFAELAEIRELLELIESEGSSDLHAALEPWYSDFNQKLRFTLHEGRLLTESAARLRGLLQAFFNDGGSEEDPLARYMIAWLQRHHLSLAELDAVLLSPQEDEEEEGLQQYQSSLQALAQGALRRADAAVGAFNQEIAAGEEHVEGLAQAISSSLPAVVAAPPVPTLRARLRAELAEAHDLLQASDRTDAMVGQLLRWHSAFTSALAAAGAAEEALLAEYVALLQGILVDPINGELLDTPTLRGSDKMTYGQMSAHLYRAVASELGNRSLFALDNPEPLVLTSADPIVDYMVGWLKRHDGYHPPEHLSETFEQIMEQLGAIRHVSPAPEALVEQDQRIAAIAACEFNLRERADAQLEDHAVQFSELRAAAAAEMERDFAPIRARISENEAGQRARLDAISEGDGQRLQGLAAAVEQIAAVHQQIENRIADIIAERDEIEVAEHALQEQARQQEEVLGSLEADHRANTLRAAELEERAHSLEEAERELISRGERLENDIDIIEVGASDNIARQEEIESEVAQVQVETQRINEEIKEVKAEQKVVEAKQVEVEKKMVELEDTQKTIIAKQKVLEEKKEKLAVEIKKLEKARSKNKGIFSVSGLVGLAAGIALYAIISWATAGSGVAAVGSLQGSSMGGGLSVQVGVAGCLIS